MSDIYARLAGELGAGRSGGVRMGGWLFGAVLAAGQGVLRVSCAGLALVAGDLHVPPELSYTWEEDTGGDNLLRAGDKLLLLATADGQDYYILQKARWP